MEPSGIVTLLTDFGLKDEYVGVMKGVMLGINPCVRIVDISHAVTSFDVVHAAFVIDSAFQFFPQGTIHVAVVDPGVGGARKIVCLRKAGHQFVVPDNGLISMVLQRDGQAQINLVTNPDYFLKTVSNTFHGRDILAPAAAHLSLGLSPDRLGPRLNLMDLKMLDLQGPAIGSAGELIGKIIAIDHFGNLITNIDFSAIEKLTLGNPGMLVSMRLGACKIEGISKSYDSVGPGCPVALFGSRGFLEISVNQSNASLHFNVRIGDPINVTLGLISVALAENNDHNLRKKARRL